jgi:hypothetical protein
MLVLLMHHPSTAMIHTPPYTYAQSATARYMHEHVIDYYACRSYDTYDFLTNTRCMSSTKDIVSKLEYNYEVQLHTSAALDTQFVVYVEHIAANSAAIIIKQQHTIMPILIGCKNNSIIQPHSIPIHSACIAVSAVTVSSCSTCLPFMM